MDVGWEVGVFVVLWGEGTGLDLCPGSTQDFMPISTHILRPVSNQEPATVFTLDDFLEYIYFLTLEDFYFNTIKMQNYIAGGV